MKIIKNDEVKYWKHFIGEQGESLARKYFEERGYDILQNNWRYGHWEIDIIAAAGNTLHIIEVKTRKTTTGGFPEENVTRKKLLTLTKAAEVYMSMDKRWKKLQFDVLAIKLSEEEPEFFLFEDVYL